MSDKQKPPIVPIPSVRPSAHVDSVRPGAGISRFVVKGLIDPQFIIVMIVSGIFEGITKAILAWRDKKKQEREIRKIAKKVRKK